MQPTIPRNRNDIFSMHLMYPRHRKISFPMVAVALHYTILYGASSSCDQGHLKKNRLNSFGSDRKVSGHLARSIFAVVRSMTSSNYSILGTVLGRTLRPWLITVCKKLQLHFACQRLILIFCWATPCGEFAYSSNTLRR